MSLLQPLETIAATGITGLLITLGAKGLPATLVKRANAYLAVANAITAAESGSVTSLIGTLTTIISTSGLDPAEGLALTGLLTAIVNQLALAQSLTGATLIGETLTGFLNNLATGMAAGANAEIAKYGPIAASATPTPAAPATRVL
jgi:hypothetical protein